MLLQKGRYNVTCKQQSTCEAYNFKEEGESEQKENQRGSCAIHSLAGLSFYGPMYAPASESLMRSKYAFHVR